MEMVHVNCKKRKGVKSSMYGLALVKNPATKAGMIHLSEEPIKNKMPYKFKEEERMLYAPLLIPNQKILRQHPVTKQPFTISFDEETCIDVLNDFMQAKLNDNINVEHDQSAKLNDVAVVHGWIVRNPKMDTAVELGFQDPVLGTPIVGLRVLDDATWADVKNGKFGGISLEGEFDNYIDYAKLGMIDPKAEPKQEPKDQSFANNTLNSINLETMKPSVLKTLIVALAAAFNLEDEVPAEMKPGSDDGGAPAPAKSLELEGGGEAFYKGDLKVGTVLCKDKECTVPHSEGTVVAVGGDEYALDGNGAITSINKAEGEAGEDTPSVETVAAEFRAYADINNKVIAKLKSDLDAKDKVIQSHQTVIAKLKDVKGVKIALSGDQGATEDEEFKVLQGFR